MNKRYINSLTQEDRAAWGFQVFIRMWLSGMCQSGAVRTWTIPELAIIFEITQADLFTNTPHTQMSLRKELGLTKPTISRIVIELEERRIIKQVPSKDDARAKTLHPVNQFFVRDAMADIAKDFARNWYDGWEGLDKAENSPWYMRMSNCTNDTASKEIRQFRKLA